MRSILAVLLTVSLLWACYHISAHQSDIHKNARPDFVAQPGFLVTIEREGEYTRSVKHMLGITRVPKHPLRIVSLSTFITDSLLALDIQPVAVEQQLKRRGPAPYLAERLANTPTAGFGANVNIEAVLLAKPDLILCGSPGQARMYSSLSRIAPTVFIDPDRVEERFGAIEEIAAILGMLERGSQRVNQYHALVSSAREKLSSLPRSTTVAALRVRVMDVQLFSLSEKVGPLLYSSSGLALPADALVPARPRGRWADTLNIERLGELSAEYLFVVVDGNGSEMMGAVERSATWRRIPAVKNNHVVYVDFDTWIQGEGLIAMESRIRIVLDSLLRGN